MDKDFMKYNEVTEMLKVLAHPARLCIVNGLLKKGECNVSHMQMCLDVPQSTVSQHLQKLRKAGIIESRRNGIEVYYRVYNRKIADIVRLLLDEDEKSDLKGEEFI